MIRILKTFLILFLGLAGPAHAAALVGLLAGPGTLTIAGLAVNSLGFRLLASVALSALSRALTPKQQQPGIQIPYPTVGGATPQSFVLGFTASEGNRVCPDLSFGEVDGTPNSYLVKVRDYGNIAGSVVGRAILNKEWVTFDTTPHADFGYPVLEWRIDGTDYAWCKSYDGTQTAADPFLLATFADDPDYPWSTDMIGYGIPYDIWVFRLNRELWSTDPTIRREVNSIPVYDPRLDSTVGGSGSHRWGNSATYEPSNNPKVCIYNIKRGITLPGGFIWGGEAEAEDLPLDNWFAAMNKCDVVADGETAPQFQCGIEVSVNQRPVDVIDELDKTCLGQTVEIAGVFKTRTGDADLPVYFFTDDDIIITEEQELDPFPGLEATFNGIQATYPDPDSLWNPKEAPARYNATWEAEDQDRRLVASVQYNAVPFPDQVQRLMRATIREERRFLRHSLTLPPEAAILEPLDAVSWTSARNQYDAKIFEISRIADDQVSINQAVAMREVDSSDVEWTSGYMLPSTPTVPGRTRTVSQSVPGWDVQATSIADGAGSARRPALAFSWNGAKLDDVRAIKWKVRVKATGQVVANGSTHSVDENGLVVSDGILSLTEYEAWARLVVHRATQWTDWISATTGDIGITAADLHAAVFDEIYENAAASAQSLINTFNAETVVPVVSNLFATSTALQTAEQRLLWLLASGSRVESLIANAGIVVDPATGSVVISGLVQTDERVSQAEIRLNAAEANINLKVSLADVNNAIAAAVLDPADLAALTDLQVQVNQVEVDLDAATAALLLKADTTTVSGLDVRVGTAEADIDALEGVIDLKVDQTEFDDAETRLSSAEVQLSSMDAPSITATVIDARQAHRRVALGDIATLGALMAEYSSREVLKIDLAFARQELSADIKTNGEAIASSRLELAALIEANAALIVSEQTARADAISAVASSITTLTATVNGQAATVSSVATAVATLEGTLTASLVFSVGVGGDPAEIGLVSTLDPEAGFLSGIKMSADYIDLVGRVTAEHFESDVISANFATLGLLKSSPSGQRTEFSDDGIEIFYSNGNPAIQMGLF